MTNGLAPNAFFYKGSKGEKEREQLEKIGQLGYTARTSRVKMIFPTPSMSDF